MYSTINVKSQPIRRVSKSVLREVYTGLRLCACIRNVLGSSLGQYTAILIQDFGSSQSLQETLT
jgi:hypothetical protein